MKSFKKIIAIILSLIVFAGILTACTTEKENNIPQTKPNNTTDSTSPEETTNPENEEDTGIEGRLVFYMPKGTYIITSSDSERFAGIYDEIVSAEGKINNKVKTALINSIAKTNETGIAVNLDKKFSVADTFSVGISEIQDWESKISLQTTEGDIVIASPMSNLYTFRLENRYVKLGCANAEFSYAYSNTTDEGLLQSLKISGQLQNMSDVEIRYDGTKYIISSTEDIFNLTVTSTGNSTDKQTESVTATSIYYGKEFEITIDWDGSPVIERTKY